MAESLKDMEKLSVDVELLRQQCEELKQENVVLRSQLQQHGIVAQDVSSAATSWSYNSNRQQWLILFVYTVTSSFFELFNDVIYW